jgi:hypothetical protein
MFTVHAPTPSAAFLEAALKARSQWLRTVRQVLSNRGKRQQARDAEQRGRRVGYLEILSTHPEIGRVPSPDESLPLSDLTDDQRAKVLSSGKLAKQFAFSGIMIIGGKHIPPHTWRSQADRLLNPAPITVTRRRVDWATFRLTRDPEPLKTLSLAELRSQLYLNPAAALYVAPGITVVAPTCHPAFLKKARDAEKEWHGRTYQALRQAKKALARAADLATRMLVHNGVLVVEGRCFVPGCWPDQRPTNFRIRNTPYQSPTVEPEYLGLPNMILISRISGFAGKGESPR